VVKKDSGELTLSYNIVDLLIGVVWIHSLKLYDKCTPLGVFNVWVFQNLHVYIVNEKL